MTDDPGIAALAADSMETVRNWMGLDVWMMLGHDSLDWPGWSADVWADMMAEVREAVRLAAIGRAVESFINSLDPDDKTATFEFWRWQGPQWSVTSFDRAGTGPTLDAAIAAATEEGS